MEGKCVTDPSCQIVVNAHERALVSQRGGGEGERERLRGSGKHGCREAATRGFDIYCGVTVEMTTGMQSLFLLFIDWKSQGSSTTVTCKVMVTATVTMMVTVEVVVAILVPVAATIPTKVTVTIT